MYYSRDRCLLKVVCLYGLYNSDKVIEDGANVLARQRGRAIYSVKSGLDIVRVLDGSARRSLRAFCVALRCVEEGYFGSFPSHADRVLEDGVIVEG